MLRIASHYIYRGQFHRMYYIELVDGVFTGMHPLVEEIAETSFYDGILVLLPANRKLSHVDEMLITSEGNLNFSRKESLFAGLESLQASAEVKEGMKVRLILLNGSPLAATELCTNDSCSDCNVQ